MKKFVALLLAVLMVFGLMTTAFAAEGELAGKTVILHTNDVHGAVGLYAKVAGLKKDYQAKGADVILVDAGDYIQGEPYVSDSQGKTAIELMNAAGYDVATFGNHEQSHVGQNYLRSLFALGFQGFLILICVAIYAVLLQNVAISGDAINSIWSIVGYTVLLCFTLFKTGSVARSILGAH